MSLIQTTESLFAGYSNGLAIFICEYISLIILNLHHHCDLYPSYSYNNRERISEGKFGSVGING